MTDTVALYTSLLHGDLEGAEALHAAQQMLSLVMDNIPIAIFLKDLESRYIGCNRVFADLAGLEPEEMIGKTDLDMPWTSYEADFFRDWDRRVMDTGDPEFGIHEVIHRRDGTALPIETTKVPLVDASGRVIGLLGTSTDISETIRAEEELKQSFAVLDERVKLRTAELSRANGTLRREVDERIRLQAEERQLRSYADAMRETAAAISSSLDVDEILEEVLVGAERLLSHDLGAVVLIESGAPELVHYRARFGYGPAATADGKSLDLAILDRLGEGDKPTVIAVGESPEQRGLWRYAKSMIAAPMKVGDHNIGFLVVESSTAGLFDQAHIDRLSTVADQAAAAISNARLLARTAEIAAVDERQRLARDLHDSVSQTMWTASLLAGSLSQRKFDDEDTAREVESIKKLTSGAVAEMRTLLLELRPQAIEEANLEDMLSHLIEGLESRRKVVVHSEFDQVPDCPAGVKEAFYRIAQEAFNNIGRHANASHVHAMLRTQNGSLTMEISDDGCGFAAGRPGGLGTTIMSERANDVGAVLSIESSAETGTTVAVVAVVAPVKEIA
jgi:PAS domain S-box-containing protein